MFIYELQNLGEFSTQSRRNLDEAKLTYAQYDGDIPADDDPADYYTPALKGVRLA
ncbi:hypothetical protein [Sporosarcina koreensis]|uniref:hypothetical protein n=1 Tax=Sporosarcina koreensis TaxID=334735 RepID=UPI000AF64931|nr:hypothetical protein [Sporosarcina koreensis]